MPRDIPDFVRAAEQYEKRRADKVNQFLRLIKDPDIQPYLELLRDKTAPVNGSKAFVPPPGFKSGNGLRDSIRKLDLSQKFTSVWVLEQLRKNQFPFSAHDELGAVSDALYAMARKGELRRINPEKAGGPTMYQKT